MQNADADAEIGWLIRFITEVRSVRAEMNVPAGAKVPLTIAGAGEVTKARVARHQETLLDSRASIGSITAARKPARCRSCSTRRRLRSRSPASSTSVPSRKRLKREIDKVGSEIRQLDAKLANEKFVSRAPEHVVEEQRERKSEAEATAAKLAQALKRLEAAL